MMIRPVLVFTNTTTLVVLYLAERIALIRVEITNAVGYSLNVVAMVVVGIRQIAPVVIEKLSKIMSLQDRAQASCDIPAVRAATDLIPPMRRMLQREIPHWVILPLLIQITWKLSENLTRERIVAKAGLPA